MNSLRVSQVGHVRTLTFSGAIPIAPRELCSANNAAFKAFLSRDTSNRNPFVKVAYVLDRPNIYLGSSHMDICNRIDEFSIDKLTDRLASDENPIVMGWVGIGRLPQGKSADEKVLGLTKRKRDVLFVDGFSDLFRSIRATRIPRNYYESQMEAISFFPSFLTATQSLLPTVLIEQISADQVLRVSHVNRHNAWEIIRNGCLLRVQ